MLFDSHAHLNSEKFEEDLDDVIKRAYDNGVRYILINGYDVDSSEDAIKIANQYDGVFATVGIHPLDISIYGDDTIAMLEELAKDPKVVAIGEIGLDYYYDNSQTTRQKQFKCFTEQLELAKKLDLPVTIHSRDAIEDTYNILESSKNRGVMHCYSSSLEYAKKFVDIGFYISLGGPVTFKNARVPKEVAEGIDLKHLLIETDCPYLTPHPNRGKRNEPMYVSYVAKEIATIKSIDLNVVEQQTCENACRLFNIKMRCNFE